MGLKAGSECLSHCGNWHRNLYLERGKESLGGVQDWAGEWLSTNKHRVLGVTKCLQVGRDDSEENSNTWGEHLGNC